MWPSWMTFVTAVLCTVLCALRRFAPKRGPETWPDRRVNWVEKGFWKWKSPSKSPFTLPSGASGLCEATSRMWCVLLSWRRLALCRALGSLFKARQSRNLVGRSEKTRKLGWHRYWNYMNTCKGMDKMYFGVKIHRYITKTLFHRHDRMM